MAGKVNSEVKAMDAAWNALSGLQPDEQRRVMLWLIDKLKLSEAVSLGTRTPQVPPVSHPGTSAAGSAANGGIGLTAKQFMAQKKPKTDGERVTCLAYYLTHQRRTSQFKTRDLTELNKKEAAGTPFSNPTVAVNNAMRDNQFLTPAGGGKKQITARGEALVDALPDREKVAAALAENPIRRRRPSKAKRRKPA